jgi:hypothetical protein
MRFKHLLLIPVIAGGLLFIITCNSSPKKMVDVKMVEVWSIEKAQQWGRMQNWLRSCITARWYAPNIWPESLTASFPI